MRPLPQAPESAGNNTTMRPTPLPFVTAPQDKSNPLHNLFVNHLLRPREWNTPPNSKFNFRREHILALTEECEKIIR